MTKHSPKGTYTNKMKCPHCKKEFECMDCETKTLIIRGVEYEIETHDKNKILSEIKIPKGWRLWKVSDFENFSLKDWDDLNLTDDWFFIQYPFVYNPNDYVAGFYASSDWAGLDCYWGPADRVGGLGVRFARDLKVKNE